MCEQGFIVSINLKSIKSRVSIGQCVKSIATIFYNGVGHSYPIPIPRMMKWLSQWHQWQGLGVVWTPSHNSMQAILIDLSICLILGRCECTMCAYGIRHGNGTGTVQGTGPGGMGPNILYRNVHSSPRQGNEPRPIVSYCAGPVPCTCSSPGPIQCEQAIKTKGHVAFQYLSACVEH